MILPSVLGRAPAAPRIVGGNFPHPSLQSHMAALIQSNSFVCSGSVISARWVITAAHCGITTAFRVSLGSASVTDGAVRDVARVISHPQYNGRRQDSPYDIALVQLSSDAPDGTRFIRVNNNDSVPEPGAFSRAFGYGLVGEKQASAPRLRQVDVPVVPMPVCKQRYSSGSAPLANSLVDSLQLCAGRIEGGCDACQGDSGGPLAVFDGEGNLVQIGVVSFGIGCARPNFPGVYTRLSFFQSWMVEVGAEFTRSTDGRTVFAEGSSAATSSQFSIAGLNLWQSIAILVAAGFGGLLLVICIVSPIFSRKRRPRAPRHEFDQNVESVESSEPYPVAQDNYGFPSRPQGGSATLGLHPQHQAMYSPGYGHAPSEQYYEGQPLPPQPHLPVWSPSSELDRPPPYTDTGTDPSPPVYRMADLENTYASPHVSTQNYGNILPAANATSDAESSLPATLYPPNSDSNIGRM